MTTSRNLTILGIVLCLCFTASVRAQHVEPVIWVEDQQLDYEINVWSKSKVAGEIEQLDQTYALQFVIAGVRDEGSFIATGRVRSFTSSRTVGDGTHSVSATLQPDGSVVTAPEDIDEAWDELAELVVQNVFLLRVDASGSIVLLARMDPVLEAASRIEGATVLLGGLEPRTLAGLIEPIFLLDEAAQHSDATWTTQEQSPLGEGRSIMRTATWRISTTNDESLELLADVEIDLQQNDRRSDLSPTGTIESYEGTVQTSIDSTLLERAAEETMTMLWRVDTLETRAESASRQTLRRLADIPRAPTPPQQQEGMPETLKPQPDD